MYRVEGQLINSGRFLGMYLFKTAKTQLIKGGGPLTSVKTINLIYFKVVRSVRKKSLLTFVCTMQILVELVLNH